jgi:hypothetical protein
MESGDRIISSPKDVEWTCEKVVSFLEGLAFGLGKQDNFEFTKYANWIKNMDIAFVLEQYRQEKKQEEK